MRETHESLQSVHIYLEVSSIELWDLVQVYFGPDCKNAISLRLKVIILNAQCIKLGQQQYSVVSPFLV